jgi:hypothetical protein
MIKRVLRDHFGYNVQVNFEFILVLHEYYRRGR